MAAKRHIGQYFKTVAERKQAQNDILAHYRDIGIINRRTLTQMSRKRSLLGHSMTPSCVTCLPDKDFVPKVVPKTMSHRLLARMGIGTLKAR